MDTVASHGPCYSKVSLGHPFPTTTIHKKHAFGKKRILLRRRLVLHHALRIHSQAVKIKEEEGEVETTESEPSSGTTKFFKLPGTVKLQNKSQSQSKSNKVVFVAGATGKVGSRTVRELLKLGFSVRASTRTVEKAEALFEDVAQKSSDSSPFGIFSPAKLFGFLKPKSGKRLEIVECNLEVPYSIEPALGNAGVVVCCIGASEKEVLDVSGPYRIDFKATENLINAASSTQAKAEKTLIQSGLPYTIVRPGGMERPTDAYKETHNLILAQADKLFGGQVSNLQVAELLASIIENPEVSVNKIVEAVAETTAPLRPIKELLEEIPVEISTPERESIKKAKPAKAVVDVQKASKKQEEEKIAANNRALAFKEREEKRIQSEKLAEEKLAQAQKEKEEKRIQAEKGEKEKVRLQALREKYEEEIEAAREKEEAAKNAAAAALAEKVELEKRVAEIRAKAEAAALAASQAKAVEAAVLAAARKGRVLSDEDKDKIMESVLPRLPKEAAPAEQPKLSLKKKPAFSFLGREARSSTATETAVETKPVKEAEKKEVKVDAGPKKQEEEKLKKEQEAKKLAEAKKKEEQERLEKEAKERADKEATEAKQKEEAEAKRKEEEAKKKEEELAEAKRKEEELAEAKRKEEELAEAKRKEEELAEAKRKEEELAEAKRKEEELAEAKRKEEVIAEAKKKEEEEKAKKEAEMLKAEEEEKAKKLAEEEKAKKLAEEEAAKQAATLAAAEEEAKEEEPEKAEAPAPTRKGFRWFWQPAEPETPDVEESTEEVVPDVPPKAEVADQLPPCPTPLSPYARYPGLKPPAPPIASPPAPKAEKVASTKPDLASSEINAVEQTTPKVELPSQKEDVVVTEEPSKDSQDDTEVQTLQIQETASREREALEKAQATISFKWPWQKSETTEEESSSVVKEEEPAVSQESTPVTLPSIRSEEKVDTLPPSSRPLSPYAQFPNLKPPSPPKASPAPQNGSATKSKPEETLASSSTPLSPYPGFPDLKPPTSPAPLAEDGAAPAAGEKENETIPEPAASPGFKWPWQQ